MSANVLERSKLTVCQWACGEIDDRHDELMGSIVENLPGEIGYEQIEDEFTEIKEPDLKKKSTIVRMKLCVENPWRIWMDWDIKALKMLDFIMKINNPFVYAYRCHGSVLCFNGNAELAGKIQAESTGARCVCKYVKAHRGEFTMIPDGYLEHKQN